MTAADLSSEPATQLPEGFAVHLREDVRRLPDHRGGELLVGGSPLRAVRLARAGVELLEQGRLTVRGSASATVARRLLDGNLADPAVLEPADPAELTVVVPVRDRAAQLDRCLAALRGLAVIVVDDASLDPPAVATVARRHGATLVALTVNQGPAGARNAGLARVATPYVAFVDSDVTVEPGVLAALAGHFADPRVALVGPQVPGHCRSARPRWFERYDEHASSLALGKRACSVRPGAAVGWLPGACLVGRTSALRDPVVGGFAADLRVGEDVDLVWRLLDAGHVVRYEPGLVAHHDARATLSGWLGRKVVYGSGGAELGRRHGDAVAPAILSPAMAITAGAVLTRRPVAVPVALVGLAWAARSVSTRLPDVPGRGRLSAGLALRGLGWAVRQESALLVRHWWPVALAGGLVSAEARRAIATALVVDSAVGLVEHRGPGPATALLGRRLDDLAYGAGLWLGAVRRRSVRCLLPKLVTRGVGQKQ